MGTLLPVLRLRVSTLVELLTRTLYPGIDCPAVRISWTVVRTLYSRLECLPYISWIVGAGALEPGLECPPNSLVKGDPLT